MTVRPLLGVLAVILGFGLGAGCAAGPYAITSETSRDLAEGLRHRELRIDEGPWVVHVLELDLLREGLEILAVHARDRVRGRERTSRMAARIDDSLGGVLAAVNADFFAADGETIGNQVTRGEVVRATRVRTRGPAGPVPHRSHFALTSGRSPVILRPVFEGRVLDGAERREIAAVNVPSRAGTVLFNGYWGDRTPVDSARQAALEFGLRPVWERGETTACVIDGPVGRGGGMPIPKGGLILADDIAVARSIAFGDTLHLVFSWSPIESPVRTMVGGTPRILLDGTNVAGTEEHREETAPAFSNDRHPRTGIGFSADSSRLYLVTVDGRQRRSIGMTLREFAALMRMLGAAEAVNLDGGGSTTMVVERAVVNRPSDLNGERAVANALIIRRTGGQAPPRDGAKDAR